MELHTHTAAEPGLLVNSYLLETDGGVIIIDTTLLNSDIAALRARAEAIGKPLLAVFVTHAHPDHFNGVHELVAGTRVPVYATTGVAQAIRDVADAKRTQWGPVYGDEWPALTAYPSVELADGERVIIDGLTITAHEFGGGESHADSVLTVDADGRTLAFIGDLAFAGTHPYTADGHVLAWLSTLDRLSTDLVDAEIFPGHGAPGTVALFDDQRRYLLYYAELVRRLSDGQPALTEPARAELETQMRRFLPDAPLTWMITLGADAVATELAGSNR
ncbi:MAG TPA: MBL fold metallo-hydrolase [Micromonosporaceae bacterium]|jgi:glyoxylase-like metal-dependent hydrolase (beta-lactamase superfamily II)